MSHRSELRQNVLTGRWVAVAPARAGRPMQPTPAESPTSDQPWDAACPFCPGNEAELPDVLEEHPNPDGSGWATRVVPNRYAAFGPRSGEGGACGDPDEAADTGLAKALGLGSDVPVVMPRRRGAGGVQEVIVESPRHDRDPSRMSAGELEALVDAYHDRFTAVSADESACRVFLFRNHGRNAGTSLLHPHAQVVGTAVIPPDVRVREIRMMAYHNDHGRCLLCDLPRLEEGWSDRVVLEDEHFTAVVPWAAEAPLEVWVIPTRHQAGFGEAEDAERRALARVLGELTRRYRQLAGDPHYNMMVHSGPASRAGSGALHWFLQLRPRMGPGAGFEIASGISLNSSLPERDAEVLRASARGDAIGATGTAGEAGPAAAEGELTAAQRGGDTRGAGAAGPRPERPRWRSTR